MIIRQLEASLPKLLTYLVGAVVAALMGLHVLSAIKGLDVLPSWLLETPPSGVTIPAPEPPIGCKVMEDGILICNAP